MVSVFENEFFEFEGFDVVDEEVFVVEDGVFYVYRDVFVFGRGCGRGG